MIRFNNYNRSTTAMSKDESLSEAERQDFKNTAEKTGKLLQTK